VGYTVIDPQTGAGGYHIAGGEGGSKEVLDDEKQKLGIWGGFIDTLNAFNSVLHGSPHFAKILEAVSAALTLVINIINIYEIYNKENCSTANKEYLIISATIFSLLVLAIGLITIFPIFLILFLQIFAGYILDLALDSAANVVCRE